MVSRINNSCIFLFVFFYACSSNTPPSDDARQAMLPETESGPLHANTPVPAPNSVYERKCATCHGSDGAAGISNAANLQNSRLTRQNILEIIEGGKGAMPSFKGQLTDDEIKTLSSYVLDLRK